jgi:adenine-specific DNA-methyltransferase
MARAGDGKKTTPIKTVALKALNHDEATRRNIPTIENEALVSATIKAPKIIEYKRTSILLYPRDAEADPQLVWRGKDQEDFDGDLSFRATPIYVHEHITPQQIIQTLQNDSLDRTTSPELFEREFNGLTEDQRLRYYEFDGHWTNRMILGDSAAVMTSLLGKEGLQGKVQMIFIDPPYGVEFKSNWQVATNKNKVSDGKLTDITVEPEQIKAYRDTWKDGIHSYLSYLRDRLTVAFDLLNETGSVFVQISDDHVHHVRCLMDEIFGPENFVCNIIYQKTSGTGSPSDAVSLPTVSDNIVWYARKRESLKYRQLYSSKVIGGESSSLYTRVRLKDGSQRPLTKEERETGVLPQGARAFGIGDLTSPSGVDKTRYSVELGGRTYIPNPSVWKTSEAGMRRLITAGRVAATGNGIGYVRFIDDFPAAPINAIWTDTVGQNQFGGKKRYVVQTAIKAVQRCILMTTDPGDLVLDPTCGAGTTAFCAEKWGRRWITIDTSRVALMLAREWLTTAVFPFYILADSQSGRLQDARLSGQQLPVDLPPATGKLTRGFVVERVPRVTLRSIANNPDIHDGMTRAQIDEAISRHGETTYFVDRPYIDKSAVRVAGPFTVESLAPTEAEPLDAEHATGVVSTEQGDFISLVMDNVRTSGIVNGEKGGRTRFMSVDPFPGEYINALGLTDDGHRFGIAIGPKEGTVGPGYMRAAAREALNFAVVDTLAVCGFAFESAATTSQMGNLLVLKVRMNQDMQLGDILKKSKGATLFRVYGEPDVNIAQANGGKYTIEVRGMDVYDPVKREVRSAGTDKIQAWLLDTNYDSERFIVRHVYFLGDTDVFIDLQRALKGEIDEEGWRSLYSAVSRPFEKPKTGKVAIKVITIYGDESVVVLKI